jgi:hypothetical protein
MDLPEVTTAFATAPLDWQFSIATFALQSAI